MRMSDSIKEIATAFAKFQAEVNNPKNTAKNPQFGSKYAPLDVVINEIKSKLASQGLSFLQSTGSEGENVVIKTLITHESGEWMESEPLILPAYQVGKGGSKNYTAQGCGSAITYGRRYSLTAMLGISSEDDDDGNHASERQGNTTEEIRSMEGRGKENNSWSAQVPKNDTNSVAASDTQKKAMRAKIANISKWTGQSNEITEEAIKNKIVFTSFTELTKVQASEALNVLGKWEDSYRPKEGQDANNS